MESKRPDSSRPQRELPGFNFHELSFYSTLFNWDFDLVIIFPDDRDSSFNGFAFSDDDSTSYYMGGTRKAKSVPKNEQAFPKGVYVICVSKLGERFSYYGIKGLQWTIFLRIMLILWRSCCIAVFAIFVRARCNHDFRRWRPSSKYLSCIQFDS